MNKNWFEIDNNGWKRMNAGRPPYELVKELIQNVLDENFLITEGSGNFSSEAPHELLIHLRRLQTHA